ncbi:hypothetical protein [Cryptosporangium phraense]|uniref:Oligosaccharide flippase family protein n=1 Tax=Cryptosporangium phraense TaxID=2593070 RepID=A0A545AJA2_9ACTN|nr:hypothetical protein [Cryptosporangium phraense]TQS41391.1 hypothetical protein FL583_30280 [Cryptosporangium phraense]
MRLAVASAIGAAPGFFLSFAIAAVVSSDVSDTFFLVLAVTQLPATVAATVGESYATRVTPSLTAVNRDDVPRWALSLRYGGLWLVAVPACLVLSIWLDGGTSNNVPLLAKLVLVLLVPLSATAGCAAGTQVVTGSQLLSVSTQAFRGAGGFAGLCLGLFAKDHILTYVAFGMFLGELGRLIANAQSGHSGEQIASVPARTLIARNTFAHVLAMGTANVSPLTDRLVASHGGAGGVTAIELADKVIFAIVTLVSAALLPVATREWSWRIASTDDRPSQLRNVWKSWQRYRRRGIYAGGGISALLAAGAMAPILGLVSPPGVPGKLAWICIAIVGLGAGFATTVNLGARLMVLLAKTSLLPIFGVCNVVVNLALDVALFAILGVAGVALSSTILRAFQVFLYSVVLRHELRAGSDS